MLLVGSASLDSTLVIPIRQREGGQMVPFWSLSESDRISASTIKREIFKNPPKISRYENRKFFLQKQFSTPFDLIPNFQFLDICVVGVGVMPEPLI